MFRVRELIVNPQIKADLIKKIPVAVRKAKVALSNFKAYYPSPLINQLPNTYSDFGVLTEMLLRQNRISGEDVKMMTFMLFNVKLEDNIFRNMSIQRYVSNLNNTIEILQTLSEEFRYDEVLAINEIEGHPDIISEDAIFEVKTSVKVATDWDEYLLQIFAYAALSKSANLKHKTIYLVLPLQECVWYYDISKWDHTKYLKLLQLVTKQDLSFANELIFEHKIGPSVNKEKGLSLSETQIDESYAFLLQFPHVKPYCHLPYTISLANDKNSIGDTTVEDLASYMRGISRIGIRGGVIHVGKKNNFSAEVSVRHMRENVLAVLEHCTEKSPLLLETPAGQKNELLTNFDEFMAFMDSIPDNRFGMCLDTCHIFASGQSPAEYMGKLMSRENWISRLRLIHVNDSKGERGCCTDRHAMIGTGYIPKDEFLTVASIANLYSIPMVIE